jgi:hypothetical protein
MQTFVGKRWHITSILPREGRWADKLEEVASICSHSRDLEAVSRACLGYTPHLRVANQGRVSRDIMDFTLILLFTEFKHPRRFSPLSSVGRAADS